MRQSQRGLNMNSHRSTAWLRGQMQWHIEMEKTPTGYKATTKSAPEFAGVGVEEHQAVNSLKEQLRDAAVSGKL